MTLSNDYIYKEKHIIFGTLNNLIILEICNKLSFEDLKINVNSFDLFYDYNNHNNKTEKGKNNNFNNRKDGNKIIRLKLLKIIFLM